MASEKHLFGDIEIDEELDKLVNEINIKGKGFLKQYLVCLAEQNLSEEQELNVANVAVQTIRSNLKVVSDETLLGKIEGIDENYLAQDIRADYLQIFDDYFNSIELPKFEFHILDLNHSN